MTPKIGDFGLARIILPNETFHNTELTGTGAYMAPKLLDYSIDYNRTALFSTDVYAFALIMLSRCEVPIAG
jgi:serine/threonine protein kinase